MSNADCCDAEKGRKWLCGWAMTLMCATEKGPQGQCRGDSGGESTEVKAWAIYC